MFENVLGQSSVGQLIEDIKAGALPAAALFSGPPASGKGTAALELGRVLSCEAKKADWNCGCPACARHRLLIHSDILCIGKKNFSAEIAAAAAAFLRDFVPGKNEPPPTTLAQSTTTLAPSTTKLASSPTTLAPSTTKLAIAPGRLLFIRAVRKLLLRFNPVLWEDDPKAAKIAPLVNSLEEDIDALSSFECAANEPPAKIVEAILKDAIKLESEGISEIIPIAQARRAAWWCRLAPAGSAKLLVIENADRMNEEGRNSLLKLLEEPSSRLRIVLTSERPASLLPTILSRLRPYRFVSRGAAVETEVIKRVFRDKGLGTGDKGLGARDKGLGKGEEGSAFQLPHSPLSLAAYLDSFLPVSTETLEGLSSYFAASTAYKAAMLARRGGCAIPPEVVLLGKYSAPRAEAAGHGRPKEDGGELIAMIIDKADKFEPRSLFTRFLNYLLGDVSASQGHNPVISGDVSASQGQNPAISGDVSASQGHNPDNCGTISGPEAVAQGPKATADARIGAAPDAGAMAFDPRATAFDPRATAFDPGATAFDPRATAFDPRATALDARATAFDPGATALDARATALDPRATALDARATALDPRATAPEGKAIPPDAKAAADAASGTAPESYGYTNEPCGHTKGEGGHANEAYEHAKEACGNANETYQHTGEVILPPPSSFLPPPSSPLAPNPSFMDIWAALCNWAESAVGTYNLRPGPVLERLFTELSRGMAKL